MDHTLNLLVIEDFKADFLLIEHHLRRHFPAARCRCVASREELAAALEEGGWDVVVSDYAVPGMTFRDSLALIQAQRPDLPVILVSGSLGEEKAVELLKQGVWDFILKDSLVRLAPAIQRSLEEATERHVRRAAEEALRESEEDYRSLFDNMLNGFAYCRMIFDQDQPRDFIYLKVNRAFEVLTGLKNVAGKKVSEVIPGIRESDPELFEIYGRVALTGTPERFEIYVAALGMWFSISVYSPRIEHFVAIFDVITERKGAEESLRQSEEQFRAMFEVASIGMAQADVRTGQWLRVNDKLCAITGYAAEEMLRLRVSEITHPEDRERDWQAFEHVVRGEAPDYRMEKRYVRKDGTLVWVNVNMTIIRGADGQPLRTMATIEDITDRKRLERERIELEAQLRHQQKLEAIGTLASGVAHEINNPITGIMNYAQLIADAAPAGSQTAEFAGEIVHETERVATIVRNLLQFARQDSQTHSPALLVDIVEQTLSLFGAVLRRDQIILTVDVPEDLPSVKCRSQQIQQVFMNLLTNARDALNEKCPGYHPDKTIRVSVRPIEHDGRRWLRLTVADRGTGISPEIQARIFDPFFTTKPRDKGTGLGLSISHGIAQDHHGVLHFETEPGQGTQFHLELPVDNRWTVEEE